MYLRTHECTHIHTCIYIHNKHERAQINMNTYVCIHTWIRTCIDVKMMHDCRLLYPRLPPRACTCSLLEATNATDHRVCRCVWEYMNMSLFYWFQEHVCTDVCDGYQGIRWHAYKASLFWRYQDLRVIKICALSRFARYQDLHVIKICALSRFARYQDLHVIKI